MHACMYVCIYVYMYVILIHESVYSIESILKAYDELKVSENNLSMRCNTMFIVH